MCDTFVALSSATRDNSVIFGKNSDREPNEAQVLEYHPGQIFKKDDKATCTYITIPQVKKTNGVLICRPFWMWGAEMGTNDKGVVIGNEAVFTKMTPAKKPALTGMDMLRLALERAASAEQAIEVIIGLLADWGQGGICGYEDKHLVYHNAYIVADNDQAWVLETSGPLWAALKIKDVYSISNGLTIEETFDRHHPDLMDHARKKGWLKKGETFNFKKCYSDWLFTTFSASRTRRSCSYDLLKARNGDMDIPYAFEILRSHRTKDYHPSFPLLLDSVCAHAGNSLTRNSSTTGSLVAHLASDQNTFWATGTAGPCTGIFKPVWMGDDKVLPDIGPPPRGVYNPETLWWHHEKLHRSILKDYTRILSYKADRDALEASFLKKAYGFEEKSNFETTCRAFEKSRTSTDEWIKKVASTPAKPSKNIVFNQYWKKQNKKAKLTVS